MAAHKATFRRSLRSALSHRRLADEILGAITEIQNNFNDCMVKLESESPVPIAAVAAQFIGQVAGMTTDVTIDADVAGAAGNVTLTGDGVEDIDSLISIHNAAEPGNTLTLSAGDGTQVPDLGADIVLSGGADADPGLSVDYESDFLLKNILDADAFSKNAQHKATFRRSLRSALSHRKLADAILDSIYGVQGKFNSLLAKLDAEAGTVDDGDYEDTLKINVLNADAPGKNAQHKATFRRSLRSALSHRRLADAILDSISGLQESFNKALADLDIPDTSNMESYKIEKIDPDKA